jgi:hypothetical protein
MEGDIPIRTLYLPQLPIFLVPRPKNLSIITVDILPRCITYAQYATSSPLRTMTGYCPSLLPPLGRTTVLNAVREFIGTEGYRQRTRKLKMPVSEMVLDYG